MITAVVVVAIVVLLGLFLLVAYNGMVRARNRVDEAWSGIDVQLKRRHDLIPNLVETVRGYATHEREAFESVTRARAQAMQASGPVASGQAESALTASLGRLFAIAEAYPQLRAVEGFTRLQQELTGTEDQISGARRTYNGAVQAYNTRIQVLPASVLAGALGFTRREFFEIEDPVDREPVKVSFS